MKRSGVKRFGYQARLYLSLFLGGMAIIAVLVALAAFLVSNNPQSGSSSDSTAHAPTPLPMPASPPPQPTAAFAISSSAYAPRLNRVQYRHLKEVEDQILDLTNAERRKRSIRPLKPEPVLALIAREHSDDMIARSFFAHTNPDGQTFADRIAYGHRSLIGTGGENIWQGVGYSVAGPADLRTLATEIISGWMSSPGHRENILRAEFSHLGVGVSFEADATLVTQKFASVQAYIRKPIPYRIREGQALDLQSVAVGSAKEIQRYDLWSDSSQSASSHFPVDVGEVQGLRGKWILRFYLPTDRPGFLDIVRGPGVIID